MSDEHKRNLVVYVIQKSNKYGLKQANKQYSPRKDVVYVIQKSNKYGLKQGSIRAEAQNECCVCHSKK